MRLEKEKQTEKNEEAEGPRDKETQRQKDKHKEKQKPKRQWNRGAKRQKGGKYKSQWAWGTERQEGTQRDKETKEMEIEKTKRQKCRGTKAVAFNVKSWELGLKNEHTAKGGHDRSKWQMIPRSLSEYIFHACLSFLHALSSPPLPPLPPPPSSPSYSFFFLLLVLLSSSLITTSIPVFFFYFPPSSFSSSSSSTLGFHPYARWQHLKNKNEACWNMQMLDSFRVSRRYAVAARAVKQWLVSGRLVLQCTMEPGFTTKKHSWIA